MPPKRHHSHIEGFDPAAVLMNVDTSACDNPDALDRNGTIGIAWTMWSLGIREITAENWKEVYAKIAIDMDLSGSIWQNGVNVVPIQIKNRIGMRYLTPITEIGYDQLMAARIAARMADYIAQASELD